MKHRQQTRTQTDFTKWPWIVDPIGMLGAKPKNKVRGLLSSPHGTEDHQWKFLWFGSRPLDQRPGSKN